MNQPNVCVEELGDIVVVRPLDSKVAQGDGVNSLMGVLREIIDDSDSTLVLDLGEVRFLCSAALNQLIVLDRKVKQKGGSWGICSIRREISEMLAITRLDSMFPLFDTQEEALSSLGA
jgi:anti-anti-sigma factor